MKKQGFTLAEVLITLVIIGIIASMTLPSLLGGTNKQEIRTGLQKSISVLSQAITLQYALTGEDFSTLNATTVDTFAKSRLNLKKSDSSGNYTTQDGIIYDLSKVGQGDCTSDNPCEVTVDVNGSKGPNALTDDSASKLSQIKDRFKLYVYGTMVTAARVDCTNSTDANGANVTSCNITEDSAAIKFLDDKIVN